MRAQWRMHSCLQAHQELIATTTLIAPCGSRGGWRCTVHISSQFRLLRWWSALEAHWWMPCQKVLCNGPLQQGENAMPGQAPALTDERELLLAYLAQQRDGIRYAAYGLTDAQARLTPAASALSIGGLL